MSERFLPDHALHPSPSNLQVTAIDDAAAGPGHVYLITHDGADFHVPLEIAFQAGPIGVNGVNGVTSESLLVVLIDRMRVFQSGPYACRQNALALTKMEEALMWMHARTHERMARNVEGTNAK